MDLPKRKPTRLKEYDYSQNGAYFITICSHNKQCIFSHIVGAGVYDVPNTVLMRRGKIIETYIQKMNTHYDNIRIEKYVIMPNHIHLIMLVQNSGGTSRAPSPTNATVPKFVSLLKRYCNIENGKNMFQRSFHDHIIRDEKDYLKIWNYIDTNSKKWKEDCFYVNS